MVLFQAQWNGEAIRERGECLARHLMALAGLVGEDSGDGDCSALL